MVHEIATVWFADCAAQAHLQTVAVNLGNKVYEYVLLLKPMAICTIREMFEISSKIYYKIFREIPTRQYFTKYQHGNISRNIFQNKCHQNNTKYFMKIFHKLFPKNISCFTQYVLFNFSI